MKLYLIDYDAPSATGTRRAWCGTQAEAKARLKELEQEYGRWRVGKIEQADIPTDKPGLLAWLNLNAA